MVSVPRSNAQSPQTLGVNLLAWNADIVTYSRHQSKFDGLLRLIDKDLSTSARRIVDLRQKRMIKICVMSLLDVPTVGLRAVEILRAGLYSLTYLLWCHAFRMTPQNLPDEINKT